MPELQLTTPYGTQATRADRVLATFAGGLIGALLGFFLMRQFIYGPF